jgi:CRISPR/Cas system-associated exonuclease Cas4 (RecB family)
MRPIRSSEIGSYLYCHRAWWYQKTGTPSQNLIELAAGTDLHRQHGRKVLIASLTRTLGMILLLLAIILLVAYLAFQWI